MTKTEDLREIKVKIARGANPERIRKQHDAGRLTARERMDLLFGSDWMEIDAFVTHRCQNFGMEQRGVPGDGVVCGYGKIDGRTVYAYAQDATVFGGSLGEAHAQKICKVLDSATKIGAPVVGMLDSGGARIQEGIDGLSGYGRIFRYNTAASGVIPQIAAIMGPCAGGSVYSPALSDFVMIVEQTSQMFITGPDVIKAVTFEEVTHEKLGGAATHARISGNVHFIAGSDQDCISQIKRLIGFLPDNWQKNPPTVVCKDSPDRQTAEMEKLLPEHSGRSYNMYDIIRLLVDEGDFYEYMPHYAGNMITCFARLAGRSVGIVANQPRKLAGCIDIDASDKAARFIRTCDAFGIPLVTLADVPGFLPGISQEHGGIIRHGAKMLYAYCEATVPKVTLILRKAYGGAYLAMCCKEMGADIVYAWPAAEIAVMGAESAASIVFRLDAAADPAAVAEQQEKIDRYRQEFLNPYRAAERGLVDDVIEPGQTRSHIIRALDMLAAKQIRLPAKKHGNIPL